ncbi:ferredoxin [Mycobacterium sp. 21AC1]|uniref:ferredoxin n=1 Tax=[Mycobacterium] appelbergii TaxID=2939269 RepID=UPI002938E0F6|nr:ferredoxin [Mycobacterium sp. 21AC1]MDV3130066.1 ferredoxin [Mycobacterium sp. 21AC1]
MKVHVDYRTCQDHGQCTIAAPGVFRMNDDGKLDYDEHPDNALRDEIEEAVDVCPAQAIFLDGE